jgi:hypothetical protein
MSFTRFHDDPSRIQKSLEESTFAGRYQINTPGPGVGLSFQEDVQLRLQGWGANLGKNTVNWESDLRGLTRPLNRDNIEKNQHHVRSMPPLKLVYPSSDPFVEESRATHPAWMYKDQDQTRWEEPWINPQGNFEIPFQTDIPTKMLLRDQYANPQVNPVLR